MFENPHGVSRTLDDMVVYLRKDGNPFYEHDGALLGHMGGGAETAFFLDALREAIGPREGWHLRAASLLSDGGIAALREKVTLQVAANDAVSIKNGSRI